MRTSFKKEFLTTTFVVYLGIAAAITIIPTNISRVRGPHTDHVNLVPFTYTFNCFRLSYSPHRGLLPFCLLHTLGNIALFFPLGILLPLVARRFRTMKRLMLFALCLSVGIETIQLFSRFIGSPRAVDIDDVLLNTFGAVLGFAFYRGIGNRGRGEWGKG